MNNIRSEHVRRLLLLPLICILSMPVQGCAKEEFDSEYTFPDEGISSLVRSSLDLKAEGFAADLCVPESAEDLDTDGVEGAAFGLFSVDTGEVISQHNVYDKVYPASTTKILTCLIALEKGDMEDIVTVPEEAAITVSGSSMADLQPGDRIRLRDLLYGLMVPSGNDAAVAIAHYISGNTENFARLMNIEAAKLGATNSNFVNPNGLPDEEHYTTVYDMYLIFNEALKNEDFREISSTAEYTCTINTAEDSANEQREVSWTSGNAFYSNKFSFADGMEIIAGKTGHTNAAGFCLVLGEADSTGKEYISIIFNSPIYEELYASMRRLAAKSAG